MAWKRSIVVGVLLACCGECGAWGPDGHMIVAEMAERQLSEAARAAVADLLDGAAMADVCVWADEVRGQEAYAWSAPLHYANLEPGATAFVMERDCGEQGCVVSAIERYRAVLELETREEGVEGDEGVEGGGGDGGATRAEKVEALKFLIHFVGDIHQPLHVSFARDRGGNDVKVTFGGRETNLHKVWDVGLIETRGLPWPLYMEALEGRITDDQRAAWAETNPRVWATESYQLAVSNAHAIPADGALGEAYVSRNIGIVETRLSQAGVRLALVLNEVFEGESEVEVSGDEASADEGGPEE